MKKFFVPIVLLAFFGFINPVNAWSPLIDTIWTVTDSGGRVDWSPDGKLIAFDRMGADGFWDLYLMNPDGSNVICLTDKPGIVPQRHNGQPAWHPSGNYIVFQAEKDSAFDPDDRHYQPSEFSTPGRGWNCDLWCVNLKDTSFTRLTRLPTRKTYDDTTPTSGVLHPHFSHDGTMLLWAECLTEDMSADSNRGCWGQWRLNLSKFMVDSSGPGPDSIWLDSTEHFERGVYGDATFYESHGFSIDDSLIIFSGNLEPGQHQTYLDIYTINLYTHDLERLTFTTNFVWDEHSHYRPDGEKIVWICSEGYSFIPALWRYTLKTEYWLMDPNGDNKERLTYFNELGHPEYTGERVILADCSWSPDGDRLIGVGAFIDTIAGTGKWKIIMIEFADVPIEEDKNMNPEVRNPELEVYPNPFTHATVIRVQGLWIAKKRPPSPINDLRLTIYDLAGRLVKSFLIHNPQSPITEVIWDGKDEKGKEMAGGVYFVKLKVGNKFSQIKKLLLLG